MGVPPIMSGRAGRPSHFQEWKLFNSHSSQELPTPSATLPPP
ncbi:hypothetical protein [Microcoleus sp. AT9b-C2]